MSSRKILLIILACALLPRIAAAILPPASVDEGYIYYVSKCGAVMFGELSGDPHPPLWNMILWLPSQHTFNMALLRLPSLLFSMLAVYSSYILGLRFRDEKTGLITAAICAISCELWASDIQIRPNAALAWSVISLLSSSLEIIKESRPRRGWLLFALTALFCASVHFLGTAAVAFLLMYSISLKQNRLKTISCLIAALIPASLWIAWCLSQPANAYSLPYMKNTNVTRACFAPASLFSLDTAIDMVLDDPGQEKAGGNDSANIIYFLLASLPIWLLIIKGVKSGIKDNKQGTLLLGGMLCFIMAALVIGSLAGKGIYQTRYLLFLTAPLSVMAICGYFSMSGTMLKLAKWAFALIMAVNILLTLAYPFNPSLWNQYWQGTIDFINEHKKPDDKICIFIPGSFMSFGLAYAPDDMTISILPGHQKTWTQKENPDKLEIMPLNPALVRDPKFAETIIGKNVFLVLCEEETEDFSAIAAFFDAHYSPALHHHSRSLTYWADIETYMLEPKRQEAPADKP
ncbi:MAG: glycosyltransferase family 39 protein [bacterium]|nr:glycosyltransferase family 39 protein [bacterium]